MNGDVQTLEDSLETARQDQTPVKLILGGQLAVPHTAFVLGRNGQTFEFMIEGTRVAMDVAHIVLVRE